LTIGLSREAWPLLPRHLSLGGSLAIGLPTFFLALAPSSGPWRSERFVTQVARFAVPAGMLIGAGVVSGYLFALNGLHLSVPDARTVALTTFVLASLYLVMALESGGSRRRVALVGALCTVLVAAYAVSLLLPPLRSFFALDLPDAGMLVTAVLAAAGSMGVLALCGFSVRVEPQREPGRRLPSASPGDVGVR